MGRLTSDSSFLFSRLRCAGRRRSWTRSRCTIRWRSLRRHTVDRSLTHTYTITDHSCCCATRQACLVHRCSLAPIAAHTSRKPHGGGCRLWLRQALTAVFGSACCGGPSRLGNRRSLTDVRARSGADAHGRRRDRRIPQAQLPAAAGVTPRPPPPRSLLAPTAV